MCKSHLVSLPVAYLAHLHQLIPELVHSLVDFFLTIATTGLQGIIQLHGLHL